MPSTPTELGLENVKVIPTILMPNRAVFITGELVNSGKADADCWIEFWVSTTRKPFERKHFLCKSARVQVKAGQSYDLARIFRSVEEGLPEGPFYIGVEVDRLGEIPERDKTNNLFVIESPYRAAPSD